MALVDDPDHILRRQAKMAENYRDGQYRAHVRAEVGEAQGAVFTCRLCAGRILDLLDAFEHVERERAKLEDDIEAINRRNFGGQLAGAAEHLRRLSQGLRAAADDAYAQYKRYAANWDEDEATTKPRVKLEDWLFPIPPVRFWYCRKCGMNCRFEEASCPNCRTPNPELLTHNTPPDRRKEGAQP